MEDGLSSFATHEHSGQRDVCWHFPAHAGREEPPDHPGDEGDTSYLALPNPNGSITVYPPRTRVTLEAKLDQISTLADADEVNTLQQLFGVADYFGCDAQGRICLSDKLRRYAGLEKDAVLVGMYSVFNIWSPALCPVSDEITPGKLNFNADVLRKYKL
jgi:MraZ protein